MVMENHGKVMEFHFQISVGTLLLCLKIFVLLIVLISREQRNESESIKTILSLTLYVLKLSSYCHLARN